MAIHIKADGTKTEVTPASGKAFTLEELQAFVGGYVETIRVQSPEGFLLLVDEDAKLKCPTSPMNRVATEMFHGAHGSAVAILGDVLLVSPDEMGE
jgi:hypothetical protein